MNSVLRISSPLSEPWVGWTMLFLLLCFAIINSREKDLFRSFFHGFMTQMERNYGDSAPDVITAVTMHIFKVGVLAFVAYAGMNVGGEFSLVGYGIVVACVVGIVLLKRLAIRVMVFVFELHRRAVLPMDFYNRLWLLLCIVLYPLMLVLVYFDAMMLLRIFTYILLGVYLVLLIVKCSRTCFVKPISVVYIFLYVLTVEVLPIVSMIGVMNKMICS